MEGLDLPSSDWSNMRLPFLSHGRNPPWCIVAIVLILFYLSFLLSISFIFFAFNSFSFLLIQSILNWINLNNLKIVDYPIN